MKALLRILLLLAGIFLLIPAAFRLKQPASPDPPVIYPVPVELTGYWKCEYSWYLEIDASHLILRDGMKRTVMETEYTVRPMDSGTEILPKDSSLIYPPPFKEPFGAVESMCLRDGRIYLSYSFSYNPEEIREIILDPTEEGPFDNILIRDDEFLDELQGIWREEKRGYDVLVIEGNHMKIAYDYGEDGLYVNDEVDFHVISYTDQRDNIYLIQDDLVQTEFYAYTQFQYRNRKLEANEMIMDADWDTSVSFIKAQE